MRKFYNHRGYCHACGASTAKHGDMLCAACWPFAPLTARRRYMSAWRSRQAQHIDDTSLRLERERLVRVTRLARFGPVS